MFRKSCEVTLRVLREKADTLLSVLKPFIYDPVSEWGVPNRGVLGWVRMVDAPCCCGQRCMLLCCTSPSACVRLPGP